VAATRNDRAGCADPAACVALLDTLDVADVARPTLARQGRRRVQKSRQKMYYHTYTKFASNHNSQLFMLYGRLVHVGETFNRSELHKNAFGGWAGDGVGVWVCGLRFDVAWPTALRYRHVVRTCMAETKRQRSIEDTGSYKAESLNVRYMFMTKSK